MFFSLDQTFDVLDKTKRDVGDGGNLTGETTGTVRKYQQALSLGMSGDYKVTLSTILPRAQACLEETESPEDAIENRILYLASVSFSANEETK